jgi:hypothetical protein
MCGGAIVRQRKSIDAAASRYLPATRSELKRVRVEGGKKQRCSSLRWP